MIQKLLTGLSTVSLKRMLVWLLLPACLSIPVAPLAILRANPDPNFWFVPRPPVPSYAMHVQYLDGGSLGGYRIIHFETDQPADKIQQFYRTGLPKRGWSLLCTPTQLEQPGCPLGLSPVNELADAYKRDDEPSMYQAIDVSVFKPGENLADGQNRLVEVIEYRYPLAVP